VKWKGYTFEESTWEPQENFKGSALQKYHTQIKEAQDEESTSEEEMEDKRSKRSYLDGHGNLFPQGF